MGHSVNGCAPRRAEHKDHVWAWDFIDDRTRDGRPLKWLSLVDEYRWECLGWEVDRSITAARVIEVLAELLVVRGVPRHIRSDNGPEFIAAAIGFLTSSLAAASSLPGQGIDLLEEAIQAHPYQPRELRHYRGDLTEISPPDVRPFRKT